MTEVQPCNARRLHDDFFDLAGGFAGALQGSGVGKLHAQRRRSPDLPREGKRWEGCAPTKYGYDRNHGKKDDS